jgi:outer membrane biosynthesis protein TonB
MSRLTQFCLALAQHLYSFTSTRLPVLFLLALALSWAISKGDVTAEVLFQSPESPLIEPIPFEQEFAPEAPPVEEVVPVAPVEPEIPVEPPPVEEIVPVEPEIPVEPQPELVQPQAEPGTSIEPPVPAQPAPDQQAGAPAPAAPEPSSRRVDP